MYQVGHCLNYTKMYGQQNTENSEQCPRSKIEKIERRQRRLLNYYNHITLRELNYEVQYDERQLHAEFKLSFV